MGRSLHAKLVYGYDLGGGEDEWKVREVDEYGGLTVSPPRPACLGGAPRKDKTNVHR